jgi:hypothetical protein
LNLKNAKRLPITGPFLGSFRTPEPEMLLTKSKNCTTGVVMLLYP